MTIELNPHRRALLGTSLLCLPLALACAGNDGDGDDEVGDTDTDSGSDDATESESGESASDTGTESTETETDTETDTGQTEITVSGEVTDFFSMSPIDDAEISVLDMPGFETVSAGGGLYSIPGMPPSTEVFFLLASNDTYWGGIRPAHLPATDIDDLQLGQVANSLIDVQLGLLQMQDPTVMADPDQAVVVVRLLQPTATGAVVTWSPPLPTNTYYGVSSENNPVLNGTSIDSSLLPFWVAFNVAADAGGAYEITVEHPERECEVLHPVFPTMGHFVTLIDVDCPPPP